MIPSIHIKNFLTFDSLEIPTLKRINLIGGKNNAGKTSLLQALLIYLSKGDSSTINKILEDRGIWDTGRNDTYMNLMFYKSRGNPIRTQINEIKLQPIMGDGFHFKLHYGDQEISLNPGVTSKIDHRFFSYVSSKTSLEDIAILWDEIVLTDIEDDVLEIVKNVIDDRITRIHISNKSVLSKIEKKPVNIKSLGEGVSRILFVALHLAMAKRKYLLIDEVETGLHYTAQEKLWEVIFEYAEKWDIQVFATTHSSDTIKAFKYACTKHSKDDHIDAQYLRLQKSRSGKFEAIQYDHDRLFDSLDLNLEIR